MLNWLLQVNWYYNNYFFKKFDFFFKKIVYFLSKTKKIFRNQNTRCLLFGYARFVWISNGRWLFGVVWYCRESRWRIRTKHLWHTTSVNHSLLLFFFFFFYSRECFIYFCLALNEYVLFNNGFVCSCNFSLLLLLKLCVELMRRLSKSEHAIFCGRICK